MTIHDASAHVNFKSRHAFLHFYFVLKNLALFCKIRCFTFEIQLNYFQADVVVKV